MKKLKSIIILTIIAVSTISTIFIVNSGKPAPEPEPPALMIPLEESPGIEIDPALEVNRLYPIQAVYDSDLEDDLTFDMVLGKPMAVQVSVGSRTDVTSVSVSIDGQGISLNGISTTPVLVSGNNIFSVYPFVLTNDGEYTISGSLSSNIGPDEDFPEVIIKVSGTNDLSIAYTYFNGMTLDKKGAYGDISQSEYWTMTNGSSRFMNSTYPVASIIADGSYVGLVGAEKADHNDPYSGLLYDCIAVANEAQSRLFGSAFGIGIGPDETNTGKDYFTWHGFSYAAGVSFGPSVKGVIVLDDYISGGAHEIGHCHGLYYGTSEQYDVYPPYGLEAYGIDLQEALDGYDAHWRAGICFMGAGPDESMPGSWVSNYVWESLFQTLLNPGLDPLALQFSATFREGWVKVGQCVKLFARTVDHLDHPNPTHKLIFYDDSHVPGDPETGYLGEVSFDASPIAIIDSWGEKISKKRGQHPTKHGAASFTCALPVDAHSFDIIELPAVYLDTVYIDDLLFIDNWMSNTQYNRITQIETHFTYDQNNEWYNLKNSNEGALMYHIIVDPLGPETILEIQLPYAEFHHGEPYDPVYEPAFELLSDNYIRIFTNYTRKEEITDTVAWEYIEETNTFIIQLNTPLGSETPQGEGPYIQLKLDYAVENDDGWIFKTDPSEYLQELPIIARYKYYDEFLKREMTARAINRFRAVGIW